MSNKIKYVMGEQNKKRDDLLTALGISYQAVSNKFNRDSFSGADLIKIADCLGVKLAFVGDDDKKIVAFSMSDIEKK